MLASATNWLLAFLLLWCFFEIHTSGGDTFFPFSCLFLVSSDVQRLCCLSLVGSRRTDDTASCLHVLVSGGVFLFDKNIWRATGLIVSVGRDGLVLMTSKESQMSFDFSSSFWSDLKIFKAAFLKHAETYFPLPVCECLVITATNNWVLSFICDIFQIPMSFFQCVYHFICDSWWWNWKYVHAIGLLYWLFSYFRGRPIWRHFIVVIFLTKVKTYFMNVLLFRANLWR